jgi:hypothetical protein
MLHLVAMTLSHLLQCGMVPWSFHFFHDLNTFKMCKPPLKHIPSGRDSNSVSLPAISGFDMMLCSFHCICLGDRFQFVCFLVLLYYPFTYLVNFGFGGELGASCLLGRHCHLSHTSNPFCSDYFGDRVLLLPRLA